VVSGWGEKKVRRWYAQEPFGVRKAARWGLERNKDILIWEESSDGKKDTPGKLNSAVPLSRVPLRR